MVKLWPDLDSLNDIFCRRGRSWSRADRRFVAAFLLEQASYRELLALAKRHLGVYASREDVEDAIDEFVLELLGEGFKSYNPKSGDFQGYFLRSLRNFCLKYQRGIRRRQQPLMAIEVGALKSAAAWTLESIESDSTSVPGSDLAYSELRQTIDNHLRDFPAFFDVFVMFYYKEMTIEEIAQELRTTKASVKVRLYRTRHILRALLGQEGLRP